MQTGWWGGNTLLIDFPFPAFPESMGHWAEVLLPVYSALVTGAWKQHVQGPSTHIDRLLLSNVRRDQLQVRIPFSRHHSVYLQRVSMLVFTADVCVLDCCTLMSRPAVLRNVVTAFGAKLSIHCTLCGHQPHTLNAPSLPLTFCA